MPLVRARTENKVQSKWESIISSFDGRLGALEKNVTAD